MAKRRRRAGGTWFPNLGTVGPEGDQDDDDYGRFFSLTLAGGGPGGLGAQSSTVFLDLTFDNPIEDEAQSQTDTRTSLADLIGSEYILKRIVGKLFVSADSQVQSLGGGSYLAALITAGFFVARAEDSSDETIGDPRPIGAETLDEARENYSPAVVSTIREPWIWRRRWILGNAKRRADAGTSDTTVAQSGLVEYPSTTAGYGDIMSGPFIDAQTIRRVSQDDRLWFSMGARLLGGDFANPFGSVDTIQAMTLQVHLDYRIFGRLVKAQNRGAF